MKRKNKVIFISVFSLVLIIVINYIFYYFDNIESKTKYFINDDSWYFLTFKDFVLLSTSYLDIPFMEKEKINNVDSKELRDILKFIYDNSLLKNKNEDFYNLKFKTNIVYLNVKSNLFVNNRNKPYVYIFYLLENNGSYMKHELLLNKYNKVNKIILVYFKKLNKNPFKNNF